MKELNGTFEVGEVNKTPVNQKFPYAYRQFESWDEVTKSVDYTEKNLLELVNSHEKASAKANEYQKVTAPYRPDPNSKEVKRQVLINNLVKTFGISVEVATQQIDTIIGSQTAETV
jgi:hypothetical protein